MEMLYEKVLDDLLINQEKLTKTEWVKLFVTLSNYIFPKTKSVRDQFTIEQLKVDKGIDLDYVSICTPNYLHDSHIRMALRRGADAICEKPLVLNPWNLDALKNMEKESGQRVWNILQLRLHESIINLSR